MGNTDRVSGLFSARLGPVYYQQIFERGIDPTSTIRAIVTITARSRDTWPELHEILGFREKVCERITTLYQTSKPWLDRSIGSALWIGFEHEGTKDQLATQTRTEKHSRLAGLRLETFVWMTILSPNLLPPPGPRPDFEAMANKAASERVENQ